MHSFFFLMINIGNYRELLLKLFCMELKLRKCFFLQKFNVRKLSLFGWLNTISGTAPTGWNPALTGRGRNSTGQGVCHGVVGVNPEQRRGGRVRSGGWLGPVSSRLPFRDGYDLGKEGPNSSFPKIFQTTARLVCLAVLTGLVEGFQMMGLQLGNWNKIKFILTLSGPQA